MSDPSSIAAYFGVIYPLLFILSAFIVYFYAEPGFPKYTYVSLTVGYFCSFGILLIVPIDIATVIIDRRSSTDSQYNFDKSTLSSNYSVFFDIILILGSFWLCIEEYYNTDGYFTFCSKMLNSIKRMAIDTAPGLIAGLIILGILLGQGIVSNNSGALQLTAIIVTNTVYEAFLMFLLGYGLVEFPRQLWIQSNLERYFIATQMKASSDFRSIADALLNVSLVVADVLKTKDQLTAYGDSKLTDAMKILLEECPSEFRSSRLGKVATNKKGQITIDTLADLRTRLNTMKDRYRQTQAKAEKTKILAYKLEDMVEAQRSGKQIIHWSLTDKDSTPNEYKWYCVYRPIMYKVLAVFAALLSILSFIGVVCSLNGIKSDNSPYFNVVHSDSATTAGIVIFIWVTLGYTVYASMWSLFQMRLAGMMELVPERTTPESLSFNVRMVARLAAPLAFFYLGWIAENGLNNGSWTKSSGSSKEVMSSAFSHFYQLQSVPAIRKTFGVIFPVMLIIVVCLIIPNILNRLLVLVKLEQYQFGAEIVTEEQLREGQRQLQRHKKTTQRTYQRGALKNRILNMAQDAKKTSIFSWLLGPPAEPPKEKPRDIMENLPEVPVLKEPAPLGGVLERKGSANFMGSGWVEVYCMMQAPSTIAFFKDKKAPAPNATADNTYDIKLVLSFTVAQKKGKDVNQLELDFGDETIKLRFKTSAEMDRWKSSLMEWKDYAIDFYNSGGQETADIEAGNSSKQNSRTPSTASTSSNVKGSATGGKSGMAALEDIVVDDDNDDKASKPFIQNSTFNPVAKSAAKGKGSSKSESTSLVGPAKPAVIEGWLEKKGGGKVHMGGDWQKRYVRIDEKTYSLVYYKTNSVGEKPAGSVDLRLVVDISHYDKTGKSDNSRFNLDMGDNQKVYKFKAATVGEGEKWVKILNEWKDYFLLNMSS